MAADEVDDATLLGRSRRDPAAFGSLFERHYDAVSAYLRPGQDTALARRVAGASEADVGQVFADAVRGP